MRWDNQIGQDTAFTKSTTTPWMQDSTKISAANISELLTQMSKLRAETATIFVNSILKNRNPVPNGDVRYSWLKTLIFLYHKVIELLQVDIDLC